MDNKKTNWQIMDIKHPAKRVIKKAAVKYVKEMVLLHGWDEMEKRLKEKNFN